MRKSVVRPSSRAFATIQHQSTEQIQTETFKSNVPLLRSKKDNKYNTDTAGSNLKSSTRNNFFSLMTPKTTSTSESEAFEPAAERSCFSVAMVFEFTAQVLSLKRIVSDTRRDGNNPRTGNHDA
ncbi:hypothetical protein J1614_010328 [Plenodomus biglobosus]|nr:hypothetical protein J1614_010328 [Plenodomus biglobosus]